MFDLNSSILALQLFRKFFWNIGAFIGLIIGILLIPFWLNGGDTFWEEITYIPFEVKNIIILAPDGGSFWIETEESEILHVVYPCRENITCWEKVDSIPYFSTKDDYFQYEVAYGKCVSNYIVYPLSEKIKKCISTSSQPDAYRTIFLALTNKGNTWIWEKHSNPIEYLFVVYLFFPLIGSMGGEIMMYFVRYFSYEERPKYY